MPPVMSIAYTLIWKTGLCFLAEYLLYRHLIYVYGNLSLKTATKAVLWIVSSLIIGTIFPNFILAITDFSVFLLPFFPKNTKKKVFLSINLVFMILYWSALLNECFLYKDGLFITGFFEDAINVSVFAVLLFLSGMFAHRRENVQPLNNSVWLSLMAVLFAGSFLQSRFWGFYHDDLTSSLTDSLYEKIGAPLYVTLIILSLLLYYLYGQLENQQIIKREKTLLEEQERMQTVHFSETEKMFDTIRSIRHDMKNNLDIAGELIEKNEYKEAVSLLSGLRDEIEATHKTIFTGNKSIDTVLDVKFAQARSKGINVKCDLAIPQNIRLDYKDAVCIFGNLIDNSIEANEKLEEGQRYIDFNMKYINSMLCLKMVNPCKDCADAGEKAADDNSASNTVRFLNIAKGMPTTKEDKYLHGIGLKNVRRCVERIGGTISIDKTEKIFSVSLVLYNV